MSILNRCPRYQRQTPLLSGRDSASSRRDSVKVGKTMYVMAPSLVGVPGGPTPAFLYSCPKRWLPFARSKRDRKRSGMTVPSTGVSSRHCEARVSTFCAKCRCFIASAFVLNPTERSVLGLAPFLLALTWRFSGLKMATRQYGKCKLLKAHGWIGLLKFLSYCMGGTYAGRFSRDNDANTHGLSNLAASRSGWKFIRTSKNGPAP
jgi:hypothetical protein